MNADPSLKDELGNTSLHLSVQLKHETKPMLSKPRTCFDVDDIAYQACNIQTVKEIIQHSIDVNAMNNRSQTALWLACCDGQDELVKILLHVGSNPNITDKDGDSSLHSVINGHCSKETVQEIINHGAHVNAANENGATALLLACSTAQEDLVKLLLRAGADPAILDADGDTSLHGAIAADCNKETLEELIDYGADVNALNNRGRTPLLLSCFYRYTDSVNVLLGAGADPSISDHENFSCLHAAVDGRCSNNTLQAVIDHGAHIDAKRKDGTTALLSACRTGQSELVMFLMEAGADVNIVKPDGNTCLHLAVHGHCSKETLVKIIEKGVHVDTLNNKGETALIRACYTKQTEPVKLLLEKGSDPNISNASGNSSIHAAVHGRCSNEALQEIITHKADLDSQNNTGKTALSLACFYRQQDSARILLEAGSNPNIADEEGNRSLEAAIIGGCSTKIIKLLIKHSADVNATNKHNQTALGWACHERNVDAINVLLKARADPSIADKNGGTCLWYAVHGDCSEEVFHAIIHHGADVNATDKENCTALMAACAERHIDAINALLKLRADPSIADDNGNTCIMFAVDGDCSEEVFQVLIDHGADVNTTNKENYTALMVACAGRHIDAINALLKYGADPKIVDDEGDTCLISAVDGDCSKDVLQAIIDHGANVNATNKDNHTALMVACWNRNIDAVNVLLKAGADPNITDGVGLTCLHSAVKECCSEESLSSSNGSCYWYDCHSLHWKH